MMASQDAVCQQQEQQTDRWPDRVACIAAGVGRPLRPGLRCNLGCSATSAVGRPLRALWEEGSSLIVVCFREDERRFSHLFRNACRGDYLS